MFGSISPLEVVFLTLILSVEKEQSILNPLSDMGFCIEFETGITAPAVHTVNSQGSDLKDRSSLEACMIGRDRAEGVHLKAIDHNLVLSPHLKG